MATVSVIIPTFNRAKTVSHAIESVLNQTMQDWELFVIDDGSTDNTDNVVTSFDNPNLNYIPLKRNRGANYARNVGIKKATGEFISFLDSDDEFHSRKLERCTQCLKGEETDCAGVSHGHEFRDSNGLVDIFTTKEGYIGLDSLYEGNPIGGFSDVMFRTSIFENVGRLDEDIPAYQDYEFFLRVLNQYTMRGIPEALVIKRKQLPEGSEPRVSEQLDVKIRAQERLLQQHPDRISERVHSEFHYTRGMLYAQREEMRNGRKEFRQAIRIYPSNPLYYYHYLATYGGKVGFDIACKLKRRVKLFASNRHLTRTRQEEARV